MAFLRGLPALLRGLHWAAKTAIAAVVGFVLWSWGSYALVNPSTNQPAPPVAGGPGGPGPSGTSPPAFGPPPSNYCLGAWPYQLDKVWTHVHTNISVPPNFAKGKNIFSAGEYDHATAGGPKQIIEDSQAKGMSVWTADHGEVISAGSWLRLGDLGSQGFEWTNGGIFRGQTVDHIAVYGTPNYAGVRNGLGADNWAGTACPDLDTFYSWLDQQPGNWVGVYCHPWEGNSQFGGFADPGSESVDQRMVAIESGGGFNPMHQQNLAGGEGFYRRALAAGRRVAPVYGVDNFGNPQHIARGTQRYTGIQVEQGLQGNRAAQNDALLARRAFACTQEMDLRFAGCNSSKEDEWHPMGSGVKDPSDGDQIMLQWMVALSHTSSGMPLWFQINAVKADGSYREVQRFSSASSWANYTLPYLHGRTATTTIEKRAGDLCYYLAVKRGRSTIGLSAPIFVDGRQFTRPETIPPSAGGTATSPGASRRGRQNWRNYSIQPVERTSVVVEPGKARNFHFYRSGAKAVAARISLGGPTALREVEFEGDRDNDSERWTYANPTGAPIRVYIEGFAQDDNGWKRIQTDRVDYKHTVYEEDYFGFEDSSDTDYNDLRVEVGGSH